MNFLKGTMRTTAASSSRDQAARICHSQRGLPAPNGQPAIYGVRPEHFTIADEGVEADIQVVEPTGSEVQVAAWIGGAEIIAVFRERYRFKPGDKIRLRPDPRFVHLFDAPTQTNDCLGRREHWGRLRELSH